MRRIATGSKWCCTNIQAQEHRHELVRSLAEGPNRGRFLDNPGSTERICSQMHREATIGRSDGGALLGLASVATEPTTHENGLAEWRKSRRSKMALDEGIH